MADKEIASFGSELGGQVQILADTATGLVTGIQTPAGKAALGGLGSGAATGTATPQALGTAAAGTATAASHEDHVHPMPTAAQTNAMSLPVNWNASTNDKGLASGTAPTNDNAYVVTVAGSTTLDGINSWSVGDIAYFSGGSWHQIAKGAGTTVHTYNYVASTAQTGVSTESAALMSLSLPVLPAGATVDVTGALTGNSDAGTTTVRLKIGTTTICTLVNGGGQTANTFVAKLVCTGAANQWLTGEMRAGSTVPSLQSVQGTVDTSSATTLNATLQNSTTTRSSQIAFLDLLVRLP